MPQPGSPRRIAADRSLHQGRRVFVRKGRLSRRVVGGSFAAAVAVAAVLGLVGSALAGYSSSTQTSSVATVPEAVELSGMVASPTYPNWYWAHSDVWKSTDEFSACSGLSGAPLATCQQVQRARIWALRIDPVTHKVTASRSFALSDPAWALDPDVAQNNDWEGIALSPPRTAGGTTSTNLVIAAIGDSAQNRVLDAAGRDITCDTRRMIELQEPNLADPTVTAWTPWKIYDIKNFVGLGGLNACNLESLMVSVDGAGKPTAYLVTRKAPGKVLARSLDESTGRLPGTPRAAAGSGLAYEPTVSYVGAVRDAKGLQFTAGDTNSRNVSLLVRKTATVPCQILTWPIGSGGLGATLTGTSPTKSFVTCNPNAEGLAYLRGPGVDPQDLRGIADTNGGSKFQYWYFPDS